MILKGKNFEPRECLKCKNTFTPRMWNQTFCGSKTKKEGCSYKAHIARIKEYVKTHYKEYMKSYQREWKKEQRLISSPYAKRQLELKRKYGRSNEGKEAAKNWRRKNIVKILQWNRKRLLNIRGIEGNHSLEEWNNCKRKYYNQCAICHINEESLANLWSKKGFDMLTKDHIIPLSKGGTDYIQNIQPLCISCNARKWAYEEGMHG